MTTVRDRIPAGRDLDRLIGERLFGLDGAAPLYSSDMAAAWRIVEYLTMHNIGVQVYLVPGSDAQATAYRFLTQPAAHYEPWIDVWAPTPALALCRLALDVLAVLEVEAR